MYTKSVYHKKRKYQVELNRRARKELTRAPEHVARKFQIWQKLVEGLGLPEAQRIPGYHDEPLQGQRFGQRSIRLSLAYRAIYRILEGKITIVHVEEIHKHAY
ncbi:MAG: type II toxin-antitoxin system RelE/ParE family toxin [Bdellovibrionales bacterium]|nr:type II toxin-antitoxin system RelE/ParE family toxin [Bdellovibrionales bacterium]